MKPIRIALSAIGPYADRIEVDLTELHAEGLFLIHGPTGAGKTFLLDAMTIALYGTPAGVRGRDRLRSDHAAPGTDTRVELEFEAQGSSWLIERVPRHERPRRRGGGTTTDAGSAALFRREGADWKPVCSGTTEVASHVRDIVGLDRDQFQQVILLPQGRFEQVLRAEPPQREALLRSLFDTADFDLVTNAAVRRAEEAERVVHAIDATLRTLRGTIHRRISELADEGIELPDEDLLDQATMNALAEQVARSAAATTDDARQGRAAAAAARRAAEAAEDAACRWDRRARLRDEAAGLATDSGRIGELRERVALAGRAESIRRPATDLRSAEDHLLGATTAQRTAAAVVTSCLLLPCPVPEPLATLGVGTTALVDHADRARGALASLRARVEAGATVAVRAAKLRAEEAAARAEHDRAVSARIEAERTRAAAARQLETVEHRITAARMAAERVPALTEALRVARERADAAGALAEAREAVAQAERSTVDARQAWQDARTDWLDALERHLRGVAGRLAARLVDGEPCAVCGAVEHPDPAVTGADDLAEETVRRLEQAVEPLELAHGAAVTTVNEARAAVDRLVLLAGPAADDPDRGRIDAEAAAEALEAARGAAVELDELLDRQREVQRASERAATATSDAVAWAAAAAERAAGHAITAQGHEDEVTAVLGEAADPSAALAAIDRLDGALSDLADIRVTVELAGAELTGAQERLDRALGDAGFPAGPTGVDLALDGLLEPAAAAELRATIDAHDRRGVEVDTLLRAPESVALPDDRPDVEPAQHRAGDLQRAATSATEHATLLTDAAEAVGRAAREHNAALEESAPIRQRALALRRIADACRGQGTGTRVSLQRWVLFTYLQEICQLASVRLEAMTSGRYTLRACEEPERGGSPAGLGIRVLDAHTGDERDVTTLSGGETFQASLALALAVADAVQRHSGGVRLDALFIDEGFGTLDPDALELAMDELDQLRAGGRSVGVISHVAALRERIPVGIRVVAGRTGSRVHVGAHPHQAA
jgi:DNA repair protein SbcC/Rad50